MTHAKKREPASLTEQGEKFISTARDIGCDESEAAFKERLKKLVSAPAAKAHDKPKPAKRRKDTSQ